MNGTVKFFNESKGFGFVTADDGKEYFVHISGLASSDLRLKENDPVTFDVEEGERGPKAVNVSLSK
ncbi:MAG: cold shock domain-containing protein [Candidatus Nanoarchaeia archaeon]|jgi:cold shock protein|nr:cold shock domain-containing protein [Candidatus Nanoarchaeia archaeon]